MTSRQPPYNPATFLQSIARSFLFYPWLISPLNKEDIIGKKLISDHPNLKDKLSVNLRDNSEIGNQHYIKWLRF